jgi:excisionase family DNA binding protein
MEDCMDNEKKLALSKDEVAGCLGVSRDSVDRAIRRGEIRVIRFGRRILIPRGELERVLQTAPAPEVRP